MEFSWRVVQPIPRSRRTNSLSRSRGLGSMGPLFDGAERKRMQFGLVALTGLLALTLYGLAIDARAQAVYGSIAGVVTDTSGAAVPGANVVITSVQRKTVYTVQTNASGFYE